MTQQELETRIVELEKQNAALQNNVAVLNKLFQNDIWLCKIAEKILDAEEFCIILEI